MTEFRKTRKLHIARKGIRYICKTAPIWMQINLLNDLCWCGTPKDKWEPRQRKYCTSHHGYLKYYYITAYWDQFRQLTIKRDNYTCVLCGFHDKRDSKFDVDHILSIGLGGECFDEDNVRTLCKPCHKVKTKSDSQERAIKKKSAKFDCLE